MLRLELDAIEVVATSRVYETAPVGTVDQPNFLNAALIRTPLSAEDLKAGPLREVEQGPRAGANCGQECTANH